MLSAIESFLNWTQSLVHGPVWATQAFYRGQSTIHKVAHCKCRPQKDMGDNMSAVKLTLFQSLLPSHPHLFWHLVVCGKFWMAWRFVVVLENALHASELAFPKSGRSVSQSQLELKCYSWANAVDSLASELMFCRAAYGLAVLQDGLRIDADSNKLLFADTIESASGHATVLDWALGKNWSNLNAFVVKFSPVTACNLWFFQPCHWMDYLSNFG